MTGPTFHDWLTHHGGPAHIADTLVSAGEIPTSHRDAVARSLIQTASRDRGLSAARWVVLTRHFPTSDAQFRAIMEHMGSQSRAFRF